MSGIPVHACLAIELRVVAHGEFIVIVVMARDGFERLVDGLVLDLSQLAGTWDLVANCSTAPLPPCRQPLLGQPFGRSTLAPLICLNVYLEMPLHSFTLIAYPEMP